MSREQQHQRLSSTIKQDNDLKNQNNRLQNEGHQQQDQPQQVDDSGYYSSDHQHQGSQAQLPSFFKYFRYSKLILILICIGLAYAIYNQKNNKVPPVSIRYKIPDVVRVFDQNLFYIQTQTNMNNQDKIKKAINATGLTLVYVTQQNLKGFAIQKYPFHQAVKYLSNRHKQEYLKSFFNHFYGGGFVNKESINHLSNWKPSRTKFRKSIVWIVGDRIEKQSDVPRYLENEQLDKNIHQKQGWKDLVKSSHYIFKPSNRLSKQIYDQISNLIIRNAQLLTESGKSNDKSKYPFKQDDFEKVFYAVSYKYKDRILQGLQNDFDEMPGENL